MAEEYELGTVGPIPTVNPNVAKIGEMLKIAKKYADQYYVKENIPLIGGMTLGETLLGKAPEEVERWGQGDYPFRNPATVVGTGGNRLDIYKTGRFEPTFDVLANVALPIAGAAKYTKGLPIGGTIQDVSKVPLTAKEAEIIASKVDELGFHSPLENAILKIQQPKGTGDQFLKQLEKTPGVKTEELEVTGLKQYLLDHPTVTKQELLDQMATSRVKLEQKVLPKQKEITNNEADYEIQGGDIYHDDDYIRSMADDLHNDLKTDEVIRAQEREALLKADPERYVDHNTNPYVQAKLEEDIDNVLFEQAKTKSEEMYYESPIRSYYDDYGYEIHGNDEMGYSVRGPGGEHVDIGDNIYDIADVTHELRMHHLDRDILDYTGNEEDFAKYADYVLPGKHENYREVLVTLPEKQPGLYPNFDSYFKAKYSDYADPSSPAYAMAQKDAQKNWDAMGGKIQIDDFSGNKVGLSTGNYQSSHFDEPNILAHTRLNDRTINGKKTLFVEEIQSDWHQAGRRKGYEEDTKKALLKNQTRLTEIEKELSTGNYTKEKGDQLFAEQKMLSEEYAKLESQRLRGGVPDAPFKKNWHELMMKQILNEAVKGDYEAVAFTTGRQQAERYNLSKQVDSLELLPSLSSDDIKPLRLKAYKNGNPVISRDIDESELPDLIGKEAAKKLLEQPMGKMRDRTLSGVEMDVGGEPMKKFYDEIIPNFVNKYGKKYGMGVKKANLQYRGVPSADDVYLNAKKYGYTRSQFNALPLEEKMKIADEVKPKGAEVHFIELSDMAKKDIKEKGQPLFSGIGLAPAPLLMDYEDN